MDQGSGRIVVLVSVAYMIGVLALWAWLGYLAGSFWVGLFGFIGLLLIQFSFNRASGEDFSSVLLWSWLGVWGISSAATIAEWAGQWVWAVPWGLGGLMLLGIGINALGKAQWTSFGGFLMAAWSLAFAVIGPLWLFGRSQEEVSSLFMDLLGQWWWAVLIGIVALAILGALGSFVFDVIRDRRARPVRSPAPRPGPARPATGANPFENAIFGRTADPGPAAAPRPSPRAATPPPKERPRRAPARAPAPSAPGPGVLVSDPGLGAGPRGAAATVLERSPTDYEPEPTAGPAPTVLTPRETVLVAERPAAEAPARERLYRVTGELVDLAVIGSDHIGLTADGRIVRWSDGQVAEAASLGEDPPHAGLRLAAAGEMVVAAGRGGALVALEVGAGGMREVSRHDVGGPVSSVALNPYGTIVAFGSPPVTAAAAGSPQPAAVRAVVLATGEIQPLLADDGRTTTAMAFSADGRRLALGGADGTVSVFDMATRRVDASLPAFEGDTVVAIDVPPAGGWVVSHLGGAISRWDAGGDQAGAVAESGRITSLAVERTSGAIAVGREDGRVTVYPAALDGPGIDHTVTDEPIVRVVFDPGGALLCAVRSGAVQRIPV